MKIHQKLPAVLAACWMLGAGALGAIELQMNESLETETRTIQEDYLFFGETFGLQGTVESLYFFGETLSFDGETTGNLIAMGETLNVDGRVRDDALLSARTLNITGTLSDTTFAAAGTVNLFEQSRIEGALFAAAEEVDLAGEVAGDLYVAGRRVVISGSVEGDVYARGEAIRIEPGARISGSLQYASENELTEEELGAVAGAVTRAESERGRGWPGSLPPAAPWVLQTVLLLSGFVFTLLVYLFPGLRGVDTDRRHRRFWRTVAWGLIPFFGYPLIITILFVAGVAFGITVPVALSLVLSLGTLAYVLGALALPQIGAYLRVLARREPAPEARPRRRALIVKTLLGFPAVLVLGLIPGLNVLLFIVVLSLGWGVAIEKLFNVELGRGGV